MSLEAFVFDAYGTLFDVHSVQRRGEEFFPGSGEPLSRLWRAKQLEYTWLRTLMDRYAPFSTVTREALAYAAEALGLALTQERMCALLEEYNRLAVFPDVAATLERLAGRKLAILSNGSPDMLEPLVAHAGLKLDAVLSVDDVKRFKPAPQVYELAVSRLGIPRERIGFVSSNGWDAIGARAFGFVTFWINRSGAPLDRLGVQPRSTVRTLDELRA
jgi:2-haloacid dehalogenase